MCMVEMMCLPCATAVFVQAAVAAAMNPFQSGCLHTHGLKKRVCNSDDTPSAIEDGVCAPSPFDYQEVRIVNQDWDSPALSSWVLQIILSELLEVPTTIETTTSDRFFNYYDPYARMDYATTAYPYEVLKLAKEVGGDCREVVRDADNYQPCANVMPFVNLFGQSEHINALRNDGIAHAWSPGYAEAYNWWIPKVLATEDPTLTSYFGLSGQNNRRKIAELFKRPTTWGDYCEFISANNCAAEDETATRAPTDEEESGRYFAEGLFKGYFRATEKNDCDANPNTCTGHIVLVPCSWGNYAVAQAYHLDIPVESDGPGEANGSYGYSSMLEIYAAANATKSAIMIYWWQPDSLIEKYSGSEYEFVPITLPRATKTCINNLVTLDERCSADYEVQIGAPEGVCDVGAVKNVMLSTVEQCNDDNEGSCSPAYQALKNYELSQLDIQQFYQYRDEDPNNDMRHAVCRWFKENLDVIKDVVVPKSYPRVPQQTTFYSQPLVIGSITVSILSLISVIVSVFLTRYYKKTKPVKHAQVDFLLMILGGLFLVALGAVVYSLEPAKPICILREWFLVTGYSLELIPLMVKVAAVNRLIQESRRMKRVDVKRTFLYQIVGACMGCVVIYLTVWTALDPPTPHTDMFLTDNIDGNKEYIVEVTQFCASSSNLWKVGTYVYLIVLLIVEAAIATQNRGIRQEFNESRLMMMMIYSHMMFIVMRIAVFFFSNSVDQQHRVSPILAILLSLDVIITICIYFAPKFMAARSDRGENSRRGIQTLSSVSASYTNGGDKSFRWRIRSSVLSSSVQSQGGLNDAGSVQDDVNPVTPKGDHAGRDKSPLNKEDDNDNEEDKDNGRDKENQVETHDS